MPKSATSSSTGRIATQGGPGDPRQMPVLRGYEAPKPLAKARRNATGAPPEAMRGHGGARFACGSVLRWGVHR